MNRSMIGVAAAMAMLGGMEAQPHRRVFEEPKETKAHQKLREERAKKRRQKRKARKKKS